MICSLNNFEKLAYKEFYISTKVAIFSELYSTWDSLLLCSSLLLEAPVPLLFSDWTTGRAGRLQAGRKQTPQGKRSCSWHRLRLGSWQWASLYSSYSSNIVGSYIFVNLDHVSNIAEFATEKLFVVVDLFWQQTVNSKFHLTINVSLSKRLS